MNNQAWLAAILWRSPRLRARLLRWRVALARLNLRGAVALAGMALAVTMGVGGAASADAPPQADDIVVVDGEVAVNDNGLCSLIEAIHNANDTATGLVYADCAAGSPDGADMIILPAGGEFTLTTADNTTYGPSGLPVISAFVTIQSPTTAAIHRDPAAEPFRVLAVGREGLLILEQVTISGGSTPEPARAADVTYSTGGGGALNLGYLRLNDSVISGNTAYVGGGVYNAGVLTGGGEEFRGNVAGLGGGDALFSFGEVELINAPRFVDNGDRYAGHVVANEGEMTLGGAIFEANPSGISLHNRGDLTVRAGRFSDADTAIDNDGRATIEDTLLSDNRVGLGNSGTAHIDRSAIINNSSGLVNVAGRMTLTNSTISGNHNTYSGAGIHVGGGAVEGLFNTITNNTAAQGGGVFVSGHYGYFYGCFAGWMSLRYSILSGNEATGGPEAGPEALVNQESHRCLGHLYLDYSLVGHDGEHGTVRAILGDATVLDEPLERIIEPVLNLDNPQSPVHRLPWGSPAVDALADWCELVDDVDQRGQPRNQDGDGRPSDFECDAGAYERPLTHAVFAPVVGTAGGEP